MQKRHIVRSARIYPPEQSTDDHRIPILTELRVRAVWCRGGCLCLLLRLRVGVLDTLSFLNATIGSKLARPALVGGFLSFFSSSAG